MTTPNHHAACPADIVHVHENPPAFIARRNWLVMLDGRALALATSETVAHRIADLLNTHGLLDIPDEIPDTVLWGPPLLEPLIDPRLPEDPTRRATA